MVNVSRIKSKIKYFDFILDRILKIKLKQFLANWHSNLISEKLVS